jgi:hypothetical protein
MTMPLFIFLSCQKNEPKKPRRSIEQLATASTLAFSSFSLKTQNSLRSNSCIFLTPKRGKYSAVQSAAVSYKVSFLN